MLYDTQFVFSIKEQICIWNKWTWRWKGMQKHEECIASELVIPFLCRLTCYLLF